MVFHENTYIAEIFKKSNRSTNTSGEILIFYNYKSIILLRIIIWGKEQELQCRKKHRMSML